MIFSLFSAFWPWLAGGVAMAVSGLVIKWLHHVVTIGKLKAADATDQAAFDDLDHLLGAAATQAIHQVAGDIGQKSVAEIAADAFAILKTLATPQVFADLAKVAKVTGEAVWPYLLARLHGEVASQLAQKVLAVPANDMAAFDALPLDQKRAALQGLGKLQVELVHSVKTAQKPSI